MPKVWIAQLNKLDAELARSGNRDIQALRSRLAAGAQAVAECVEFIVAGAGKDPRAAFAGAVPFLKLMGVVAGGWQLARAALAAEKALAAKQGDAAFFQAKIATARFFGDHVLVLAPALKSTVLDGAAGVLALDEDQFLGA